MSTRVFATTSHYRTALVSPGRGVLQRKCACGGAHSGDEECAECASNRLLSRKQTIGSAPGTVPPIVHQVLRSSGQPLDASTRAFMELRFGHNFSQVRVHTDAQAAESARAVSALAYTVGRRVVFAGGQYAPSTSKGRRLLAHELVHTIQQGHTGDLADASLGVGAPEDAAEREADAVAEDVAATHRELPNAPPTSAGRLQRKCSAHPGEAYYRSAVNYCHDTPGTSVFHPDQRCYREVPVRTGYLDCPPGDQVCFDASGKCHDSYDDVSPVESKNADGTCNLHGLCSVGHGAADVLPFVLGEIGEAIGRPQVECVKTCETLPWYSKGLCMRGCMPMMGPY
jgi:uncharacterized protein DUF4157